MAKTHRLVLYQKVILGYLSFLIVDRTDVTLITLFLSEDIKKFNILFMNVQFNFCNIQQPVEKWTQLPRELTFGP